MQQTLKIAAGLILGAAALGAVVGCGQSTPLELAPQNPLEVPTPTPVPTPSTLFEDFEGGLVALGTYADGGSGASASGALNAAAARTGANGLRLNLTGAGWGCGAYFESSRGNLNFTSRTQVSLWVKSNNALANLVIEFNESGTGDNAEVWQTGNLSVPGGNVWTNLVVSIAIPTPFSEDAYGQPSCAGTCNAAGKGNSAIDLISIQKFQVKVTGATPAGTTVDVDDITFI